MGKLSEDKWTECQTILINEKRADLKDNAANLRFKKKINKITKLWKEQRKKTHKEKSSKSKKRTSFKTKTPTISTKDDEKDEVEHLRMENRTLRRELSSKNSELNKLNQEFKTYKIAKEDELKKLNIKYNAKSEEYEKLLRNYKAINKRINSKYHNDSAKDKEINDLKTDKSTLLNDINAVMKDEQMKYDKLLTKYQELKLMNNRNLKYKLKYKKEKKSQSKESKHGHHNFTVDLNNTDLLKVQEMDILAENNMDGGNESDIDPRLAQHEYYRPKKYKPSKEKRARARKRQSEIIASKPK